MSQPSFSSIFVFRRNYGRRYTELPVDELDRDGFTIVCSGSLRPEHFDLQPGDIVRWRSGEQYIEATLGAVHREADRLRGVLADAHPLPEDYFPY
jgi:hypothetical protein